MKFFVNCLCALLALLVGTPVLAAGIQEFRLGMVFATKDERTLCDAILTSLNSSHMQNAFKWQGRGVLVDDAQFVHVPGGDGTRLDAFAERLMQRSDMDLVISFSAEATQALVRHSNGRTHILHQGEEALLPGNEMPNVHMASERAFTRDTIGFLKASERRNEIKSIALVYENTPQGKRTARLEEMAGGCKRAGVTLLAEPMPDSSPESCRKAIDALVAKKPSFFYLTPGTCFRRPGLEKKLETLILEGIPTYGDIDPEQAKYGAMLTITPSFQTRAWQAAFRIASILSGKKVPPYPGSGVEKHITLNLAVAAAVGFLPSYSFLAMIDEMFWKVHDESADSESQK